MTAAVQDRQDQATCVPT